METKVVNHLHRNITDICIIVTWLCEILLPAVLINYAHHQVRVWPVMVPYKMENGWFNQYNTTSSKIEECILLFWLSLKIIGSFMVTCAHFELMNNQRLISITQWRLGWWERFRLRPCLDEVGYHLFVTRWYDADILCCLDCIHSAVIWSGQLFFLPPLDEVKVTDINTWAYLFCFSLEFYKFYRHSMT